MIETTQHIAVSLLALFLSLVLYIFYPALLAAATAARPSTVELIKHSTTLSRRPHARLSIIIPAYNEQARLTYMLETAYQYLSQGGRCKALSAMAARDDRRQPTMVEWILVDDGSTDATVEVYRDFVKRAAALDMRWKLVQLSSNAGKGAAVAAGMIEATADRSASPHYCLMVDADGATAFGSGLEALTAELPAPVVWGSRAHLQDSVSDRRHWLRHGLMLGFHLCVRILTGADEIKDTQCGFKLFEASVAARMFRRLHLRRWAFDTELVVIARRLGYPIREVAVDWKEVDGSKLHTSALGLAHAAVTMLRDMVCVRLCYATGLWTTANKKKD